MNKYLLDTHTLIWFLNGTSQLSEPAKRILEDPASRRFVSIVTLWEQAIKLNIGKLSLRLPLSEVPGFCTSNGFEPLVLDFEHCETYRQLPLHHRDPFDRILVAQAQTESLTILTCDPEIVLYDVSVLW